MKQMLKIAIALWLAFTLFGVSAQEKTTRYEVRYVSAENVYLAAGSQVGLAIGDTLEIRDRGKMIARVLVTYVAEQSSSCQILTATGEIRPGMGAVLTGTAPQTEPGLPGETESGDVSNETKKRTVTVRTKQKSQKSTDLSGSISLRYYTLNDLTERNLDFKQPTFRINLRAKRLWGKDYTLRIHTRTRHDERTRSYREDVPKSEWRNRIYQFALGYENRDARVNFRLGRITTNRLSGVGYIDGLQLQFNLSPSVDVGILGGTQPNWRDSAPQTNVQKAGAFLHFQNGEMRGRFFETTVAAAGAYADGVVSREFLYWRSNFRSPGGFSFFHMLEMDMNRNWRKEKTGKSAVLSNLYLSARQRISDAVTAGVTFDNRQNYWTYEIRTLADSLFDDALRTGFRGNLSVKLPGRIYVFANGGLRKIERDNVTTTSYAIGLNRSGLPGNTSLRLNGSGFSNKNTNGTNIGGDIGKSFSAGHRIDIGYSRYAYSFDWDGINRVTNTYSAQTYLMLPARLFFSGLYQYDLGDDIEGFRMYLEFGYRF